jgi:hypothetical protein
MTDEKYIYNKPITYLIILLSLFVSIACGLLPMSDERAVEILSEEAKGPEFYIPEKPTQYIAEVQQIYEVSVNINQEGYVVTEESNAAYVANASMKYVLKFWDVGLLVDGYSEASIYRVYTPTEINFIPHSESLSNDQEAAIYGRSDFPTTEVLVHTLKFTGGTTGTFTGTNANTGNALVGYMDWREDVREMHVVFTEDIQQDYLVIAEEPFYNWP